MLHIVVELGLVHVPDVAVPPEHVLRILRVLRCKEYRHHLIGAGGIMEGLEINGGVLLPELRILIIPDIAELGYILHIVSVDQHVHALRRAVGTRKGDPYLIRPFCKGMMLIIVGSIRGIHDRIAEARSRYRQPA